jgi:hypothetical protein
MIRGTDQNLMMQLLPKQKQFTSGINMTCQIYKKSMRTKPELYPFKAQQYLLRTNFINILHFSQNIVGFLRLLEYTAVTDRALQGLMSR